MPDSETTASTTDSLTSSPASRKPSYWAHMVSQYEKRNASLEQRQTELAERIRLMECAVPSLLMGAMVSMKRNADPVAKYSTGLKTNEQTPDVKEMNIPLGNEPTGLRRPVGIPERSRFGKNTDFRP